jgi:cytochrome c-type biogenesis protein CcmH
MSDGSLPPCGRLSRRRIVPLPVLLLLACVALPDVARGEPAAGVFPQAAEVTSPIELGIQKRLMAPCCWAGTIDNHDSAVVSEMKGEIRRRLAGGETADAILARFVARYGPRVLAEPPTRGLNVLVYLLPALALLCGGALVIAFLRRQVRTGAAPVATALLPSAGAPPADDPYARRVEEALRRGRG